jgi:predicted dehydrogenase
VGIHWLDLFAHYLEVEPVSVHAVGQKALLANWNSEGGDRRIDTFDAMQVSVDYRDGLRVYYVNSWINPKEFEGAVNQEMELAGTRGKVEFDQQDRGLRATITGVGSRTYNPHFTADIARPGSEHPAYDGYGKDSIVAITQAAIVVSLGISTAAELENTYPTANSSRSSIAVIEAAADVAERNHAYLESGRGSPVTARITETGYEINDPLA